MDNNKVNNAVDNFLNKNKTIRQISDTEQEVCDLQTGKCTIVKSRDGLIERMDKTFITEDGRQLLI